MNEIRLPQLPKWSEAARECDRESGDALDRFIYDNEPADDDDEWRQQLEAVIRAAIELGRQGRGEPVAWVRNLTDPQPHCVTDLRYRTAADADAGVAYVPVFAHPQPAEPVVKESLTVADPVNPDWREGCTPDNCSTGCGRHVIEGRKESAAYQAGFNEALEQVKARIGVMQNKDKSE